VGDGNQAEITNPKIGMMGREALADPGAFWASAGEALPWRRRWDAVFDWNPDRPDERGRYFRWYRGGLTNIAWNAVGRHVERGRGGVPALVCENERGGRAVLDSAGWTVDVPAGWHAVRFSVSTGGAASAGVQLSNVRLPAPSVIPGYPVQVNG